MSYRRTTHLSAADGCGLAIVCFIGVVAALLATAYLTNDIEEKRKEFHRERQKTQPTIRREATDT